MFRGKNNVSTILRYIALGFGALLVGMQVGYTVHYTSRSTQSDVHRDAYKYMVALHDMEAEGLISDSDLKYLVAQHRSAVGGEGASAVQALLEKRVNDDRTESSKLRSTGNSPVQVDVVQTNVENADSKLEANGVATPNGLCDGGNPRKKKLVFIKTHKTGSSTVTNILHRVIQNYGYAPAVPTGNLYYAWPSQNERAIIDSVDPRIPGPYNIAGSGHSRYNRQAYDKIMGPGTHYVTVVRDPRSHIYSSFSYWSVPSHVALNNGPQKLAAEDFVRDPEKYWKFLRQGDVDLLHNNMCYDLGGCENGRSDYQKFTPTNFRVKGMTLDEWIQQMVNEFSLIMITDYMDESLVLLKQLMCWKTEDIIYLGLKMKSKPRKGAKGSRPVRTKQNFKLTQEEVNAFAPIDVELYRYFNKSLWDKIEAQGDSFYDELHEYQDAMWEFSQKCRKRLGSNEYSDDAIRYFLEDDPSTPEEEKPCWEAVLDSGGFVKHLKREFGVHPSRTECIAQARNRHILQVRHNHPMDQELYKSMMQGVVEFRSTVDFTGTDAMHNGAADAVFSRCKPSFGQGGAGTMFHLAANFRYNQNKIKSVNPQLGLKRVTVMRGPVAEFLNAWAHLDVGAKLLHVVQQSKSDNFFFLSDGFKQATKNNVVPLDLFIDNYERFLPFLDEALGLDGKGGELNPLSLEENPFGICDRVLFNRQTCKMYGPEPVQKNGNLRAKGAQALQGAIMSTFDAILVDSDMGGSLVFLRRWLCWPIELVSMISAKNWQSGTTMPGPEKIPGYTSRLNSIIRELNQLDAIVYEGAERQILYQREHSVGFKAEADELQKTVTENEMMCRLKPSDVAKNYKREIDGVDRITPTAQCEILKMVPAQGKLDLQSQAMDYFHAVGCTANPVK